MKHSSFSQRVSWPGRFMCMCLMPALLSALPRAAGAQAPGPPPAQRTAPKPTSVIHLDVNRILVPVVVRDKQGHCVAGLTRDDFKILDDGRTRPISGFSVLLHQPEVRAGAAIPAPAANAEARQPSPRRFVVLLFDDMHISQTDLYYVKMAEETSLTDALEPSDYAAVLTISGEIHTDLTRDRASLLDAIKKLHVHNQFRTSGLACPNISYAQAVEIRRERIADAPAYADAMAQVSMCSHIIGKNAESIVESTVSRVLNVNRQDVISTYAAIWSVVRAMGRLPGERRIILISPGFASIEKVAMSAEARVFDLALRSDVSISTLDASGLLTNQIDASQNMHSSNGAVNLTHEQQVVRAASLNAATLASLANGTGGTFFHNSNSMQNGFRDLVELPHIQYILEFSPKHPKADGSYHRLQVKVHRKHVHIVYRRGYVIPKPRKQRK